MTENKIGRKKNLVLKFGKWAFLFFLLKGLAWLLFAVILSKNI